MATEVSSRWIMHVDMDAFYASIEQHDQPELRGRPVIVGGSGGRSVVSAASYEARAFGVRSAMPLGMARRLCPEAIVVPVRMARYQEVSARVIEVLHRYSPRVEKASVDEAYLDASGLERLFGPVERLARDLKAQVAAATDGLVCSVGLAPVKFLAKIASDYRKPNGLFILFPEDVPGFLRQLPVERIPGVGRTFCASLQALGVACCEDVWRYPREFWLRRFGKAGARLFDRARGIDPSEVEVETVPKSESAEVTFEEDSRDPDFLRHRLFQQADRVGRRLRRHGLSGRTVTLKIKYADFRQITRQTTLNGPTCATQTIYETACRLLDGVKLEKPVRLIGVGVSGFDELRQLFLPLDTLPEEVEKRRERLDRTMDALTERFGRQAVVRGRLFKQDSSR